MIARAYKKGTVKTIWMLYDDKGRCQHDEYLRILHNEDTQAFENAVSLLDRVCDHGPPRNTEKFKRLSGRVCEIKSYNVRLLCFEVSDGYVVAIGHKKSLKAARIQREILRTERLMKDFDERGAFDD